MANYRVKFFKTVLSSDGHRFRCHQRTLEVDGAADAAEAIRSAWVQYEQVSRGMSRYCADAADAELIESIVLPDPAPLPAVPRASTRARTRPPAT